ncbi:MAG: methionyl-tRNA formyltransferase [Clostridiales bacterium]|jgi:hypothetical protein|nr:methionyl-tRNA formyltransferase [Clostridiales bacterium]
MRINNKPAKLIKQNYVIHRIKPFSYSSFTENGEKFLQIDGYARQETFDNENPAQSLQFNKETAVELVNLIKHEFGI